MEINIKPKLLFPKYYCLAVYIKLYIQNFICYFTGLVFVVILEKDHINLKEKYTTFILVCLYLAGYTFGKGYTRAKTLPQVGPNNAFLDLDDQRY